MPLSYCGTEELNLCIPFHGRFFGTMTGLLVYHNVQGMLAIRKSVLER